MESETWLFHININNKISAFNSARNSAGVSAAVLTFLSRTSSLSTFLRYGVSVSQ